MNNIQDNQSFDEHIFDIVQENFNDHLKVVNGITAIKMMMGTEVFKEHYTSCVLRQQKPTHN
jgi:hypothetical protein